MRTYKNIARVVSTHGRKGDVLVAELRGLPFLLFEGMRVALIPPALKGDRFHIVETITEFSGSYRVKFSGVDSLDSAERIVGDCVLAAADDIDLGPMDRTFAELIGREVIDERYGSIGTLTEIMETPANDVWVVVGSYGEVLLPVIDQVISSVPDEGPIEVHVLDGLIDADC